ncbi:MAG: hypothetical protein C0618_12015 [Desulfuromonas sp.]|nr:MAG: hypothetical protein C0618_12015 [Desulfuromonas sp.]
MREDDARGRHTTTARSGHFLPAGGLLIDSPGIRELQLSDCEAGVSSLLNVKILIADQHREHMNALAVGRNPPA